MLKQAILFCLQGNSAALCGEQRAGDRLHLHAQRATSADAAAPDGEAPGRVGSGRRATPPAAARDRRTIQRDVSPLRRFQQERGEHLKPPFKNLPSKGPCSKATKRHCRSVELAFGSQCATELLSPFC